VLIAPSNRIECNNDEWMSLAISVWVVVGEMVVAWTFQGRLKACQGPPSLCLYPIGGCGGAT